MTSLEPNLAGTRWLLLGGAGFIGSHILREFLGKGAECFVFDNLVMGKKERIPSGVTFILGDATHANEVLKACKDFGITGIVHLAAFMQARESVRNPIKFWSNNLGASLALASILKESEIKHVIFSSSCSVYGNTQGATEDSPMHPMSPYAMTKVASEQVLQQACTENHVRLSVLRYFNVIGNGNFPSANDHSVETLIPASARQILANTPPTIFGGNLSTPDGSAIRDYLDVRDLAVAHELIASSPASKSFEVCNVSSGYPVSVRTLLELLLEISGSNLIPEIVSAKEGDPDAVWAEGSSELYSLGWRPTFTLRESIQAFWDSFTDRADG